MVGGIFVQNKNIWWYRGTQDSSAAKAVLSLSGYVAIIIFTHFCFPVTSYAIFSTTIERELSTYFSVIVRLAVKSLSQKVRR